MPEWLSHLITALVTGGGVMAFARGYVAVRRAQDASRQAVNQAIREQRADEIDVLHQALDLARKDIESLRKEQADTRRQLEDKAAERDKEFQRRYDEQDREIGVLKDEHTACLIESARLRVQNEQLSRTNKQLAERVAVLETQMAELRDSQGGGK